MAESARVSVLADEKTGQARLVVRGDIDVASELELLTSAADLLGHDTIRSVVIDVARVTFLDAYGLGVLIKMQQLIRGSKRCVTLRNPSCAVTTILRLTAVNDLFQ